MPCINEEQLLNDINHYFLTICPDVNRGCPVDYSKVPEYAKTLVIDPATPAGIMEVIKSLKNKKSVGHDEIPVCLVKGIAEEIIGPLT